MMKKIFFVLCLLLSLYLCTGCGKNEQVVDNTVYVKTQTIDYGASSNEDNYAGVVKLIWLFKLVEKYYLEI